MGNIKKVSKLLSHIPYPLSPLLKRLKKKVKQGKYKSFISTLRELMVNIPLVESLEEFPINSIFMNDFVTMNFYDPIVNMNHYSEIAFRNLGENKKDP